MMHFLKLNEKGRMLYRVRKEEINMCKRYLCPGVFPMGWDPIQVGTESHYSKQEGAGLLSNNVFIFK